MVVNEYILDAQTGAVRFKLPYTSDNWGAPVVVDLDLDGKKEILLDNDVFDSTGGLLFTCGPGGTANFPHPVNIDSDPEGEVLFANNGALVLCDTDGTELRRATWSSYGEISVDVAVVVAVLVVIGRAVRPVAVFGADHGEAVQRAVGAIEQLTRAVTVLSRGLVAVVDGRALLQGLGVDGLKHVILGVDVVVGAGGEETEQGGRQRQWLRVHAAHVRRVGRAMQGRIAGSDVSRGGASGGHASEPYASAVLRDISAQDRGPPGSQAHCGLMTASFMPPG